jgi:hypothetical protein
MKNYNLYFIIFNDLLIKIKSVPKNRDNWKFGVIFILSYVISLNLFVLMHFLQNFYLDFKFYDIEFDYFIGNRLDYIITYFILYFLPSIILNIFTLNFYLKNNNIFKSYKYYDGKFFLFYSLISLIVYIMYLFFLAFNNG